MRALDPGERLTGRRSRARARYAAYMASATWRQRRRWWLAEYRRQHGTDPVCAICSAPWDIKRDDLHHHDYQRLGEEAFEDLEALCRADHELLHRTIRRSRAWKRHAHSAASRALTRRLQASRTNDVVVKRPQDQTACLGKSSSTRDVSDASATER